MTTLLPEPAREALRRAAATPVTGEGDRARIQEIERTLDRLRMLYPTHFRQDQEDADRSE